MAVAWPLLAELLLGFGVGLLGLWLASRESDTSSAAFALANQWQGTFFLLFRIISMGVSVVITQYVGAGNREGADETARASLGASMWLGLGTGLAILIGARPLLTLLNATPDVVAIGAPYLQMLALALLLDAFNASMAAVLRAHLHTRDTMLTILAMHALHLLLCIPLMRGWGPIPSMGLVGFAMAMAFSRAFGLCAHLLLWRWRLNLVPRRPDWFKLQRKLLSPVLHIGLPGAAENIAYRLAMLVSVTVVGGMGATALATQTYTFQIMNMVVLFTVSVAFACEILVGHMIGAGQFRLANRLLRKCMVWGLGVSLLLAALAAATAQWTLTLFTRDASIIAQSTTLLWIAVVLEPGRTCNVVIINALRATGDARFPVAAGALSMLLVMAGGSWLLGVHYQLGLVGVWIAYAADEWLRGMMMAARWLSLGWLPSARATRRRVTG